MPRITQKSEIAPKGDNLPVVDWYFELDSIREELKTKIRYMRKMREAKRSNGLVVCKSD